MELDKQAKEEIEVFASFAELCPLLIDPGTIEKQQDGDPDIRCLLTDGTEMYFELTEIVDPDLARNHEIVAGQHARLQDYVSSLSVEDRDAFDSKYSGTMFHVIFKEPSSNSARSSASQALIEHLVASNLKNERYIPIPENKAFRSLQSVQAHQYDFNGAAFTVSGGIAFKIPAVERIKTKFNMSFSAKLTIHLLVYTSKQPVLAYDTWLPPVIEYVEKELKESCFQKVWVFDHRHENIILEYL